VCLWPERQSGAKRRSLCLRAQQPAANEVRGVFHSGRGDPVASQRINCQTPGLARSTPTDPLPRPLPRELVRDLLGITRALYRAELAKPSPDRARVERLLEIGKQYPLALDMSGRVASDTMGARAALGWAEKATAALGALVADSLELAPAVAATAVKLRARRG
jgi:hypothetical protein